MLLNQKKEIMKKCIYCKCEISEKSIIDFCESCGRKAFGDKLFHTIVQNMREASARGDLEQGRVV
jgi:rRNA maturation endonuclease Nob1